jgi:hypothetical protein
VEERKRAAGAHTRWLPSRDRIRTVGTVQVVEDLTPGGGRSELFLLYTGGSRGGGHPPAWPTIKRKDTEIQTAIAVKWEVVEGYNGGTEGVHRASTGRAQEECEGKARSRRSGAHDPRHSLILRMLEVRDRGGWVGGRGGAKRHWNENSLTAVSRSRRKDDARTGLLRLVWDDDASDKW